METLSFLAYQFIMFNLIIIIITSLLCVRGLLFKTYIRCPAEGSVHTFSMFCDILQRKQLKLIEVGQHHVSEHDETGNDIPDMLCKV